MEKFDQLPEVRVVSKFARDIDAQINDRVIDNVISFFSRHLKATGTRHAADQNIHDALLTALVDEKMQEDRLITAVAKLFGVRWHA
eukprot:4827467-Prymnesium_polylepis.1